MPQHQILGATLAYEEAGSGSPLLLLHGGLGTALLHWWRDIPFFAAHHRVLAPDLPGYGRSSPPRTFPLDFYDRDAAAVAELLRTAGAAPAHVAGWSDGGVVALILAAVYPELVQTLTVIAGEARLMPEERAVWPRLADAAAWTAGARRRFIEAQGPENWPGILSAMVAGYNRILDERGGEIVSRRLGAIRCPTVILHGDADDTVPVAHAFELHAAITGSRLHILPGAGHALPRERETEMRRRLLALTGSG